MFDGCASTSNTLWPRRNGRHLADDIFDRFFVYKLMYSYLRLFRPKRYCSCLLVSVCPSVCLACKLYFVNFTLIARHKFELESPNLHQTCILGYSLLVLKNEVIDFDLKGHFGHFDSGLLRNSACPRDNSSQISARITKFAPNLRHGILSLGIENGGHWLWAWMSFWPFDLEF